MNTMASDYELQRIIDNAIVNNPFNTFENVEFARKEMRSKGFRPITTSEYRQSLLSKQVIRLWLPLKDHSIAESKGERDECKLEWEAKRASSLSLEGDYSFSTEGSLTITDSLPSVAVTTTSMSQQATDAWNDASYLHYVPTEFSFEYGQDV